LLATLFFEPAVVSHITTVVPHITAIVTHITTIFAHVVSIMAMLSADVMTVDPMMAVAPMPRHPKHFPVVVVVGCAVVEATISELNPDSRIGRHGHENAREDDRCD
jgi:uncharacterized membrane protein